MFFYDVFSSPTRSSCLRAMLFCASVRGLIIDGMGGFLWVSDSSPAGQIVRVCVFCPEIIPCLGDEVDHRSLV